MERKIRLQRSSDFARLQQQGSRYQHRFLTFSMAKNELPHNRYGFVVSKRVGNAVTRNRVRRLLREALRLLHPHLRPGFDIVVVVRPAIVGQPFEDIRRIVESLAQQAGLLRQVESDLL